MRCTQADTAGSSKRCPGHKPQTAAAAGRSSPRRSRWGSWGVGSEPSVPRGCGGGMERRDLSGTRAVRGQTPLQPESTVSSLSLRTALMAQSGAGQTSVQVGLVSAAPIPLQSRRRKGVGGRYPSKQQSSDAGTLLILNMC
jgi:hypothetical protein